MIGKRSAGTLLVCFAVVLLASCHGHLPRGLRDDISAEKLRRADASAEVQKSQDQVAGAVQKAPDVFNGASVVTLWQSQLAADRQKLNNAKSTDAQLEQLAQQNRADSRAHAEQLLSQERDLRYSAVHDADAIAAQTARWLSVHDSPVSYVAKLGREYDAVHSVDLGPVTATVEKAEEDWPKKKSDLALRLQQLTDVQKSAAAEWKATQTARNDAAGLAGAKLTGADVAVLVKAEDEFSTASETLHSKAGELPLLSHQLYDAWDKILVDLDKAREDGHEVYREKVKTVRTHFNDAVSAKADTTSDERWMDVSQPVFASVEKDLGMAVGHKDAGVYDSEAMTTPQPPGFAYIATPAEGRNQYGYWSHEGGQSIWTFLPEYLLLRELMWGHQYQPIYVGEYEGYRTAARTGSTYYGGQTATGGPPKYGSHGTFTATRYGQSRYVQSGGFAGSAFGSRGSSPGASAFGNSRPSPGSSSAFDSNGAGRRFGAAPGASSGRRFGGGGGIRSSGRSFGRRR